MCIKSSRPNASLWTTETILHQDYLANALLHPPYWTRCVKTLNHSFVLEGAASVDGGIHSANANDLGSIDERQLQYGQNIVYPEHQQSETAFQYNVRSNGRAVPNIASPIRQGHNMRSFDQLLSVGRGSATYSSTLSHYQPKPTNKQSLDLPIGSSANRRLGQG